MAPVSRGLKHLLFKGTRTLCSRNFGDLCISSEVSQAIKNGAPVVALESTIITHGMPYPTNLTMSKNVENIIRSRGAVPATVAIIKGRVHVGLSEEQLIELAEMKIPAIKTSRRDFPYVMSRKLNGGTTVSGTMVIAHKAKIPIFVTGGIGGVHRGGNKTLDISADLTELGRTPVAVVSAGVKSILDIGLTLEYLETQGVCVATLGPTRDFPAFFSPKSGFLSPYCVRNIEEAAELVKASLDSELGSGLLLAVPIPESEASTGEVIESAIKTAVEEAEKAGISGREVTPFILARVNELTSGDSLEANLALIHNNAQYGADVAVHLAKLRSGSLGGHLARSNNVRGPLVVGGSNFDFVAHVTEGDICFDGSTHKGKLQYSHGGVGRNIADALAYLDARPTFLSAVGQDKPGNSILGGNSKLDTSAVMIHPTAATATYTAIIDSKGECKFGIGDMAVHDQVSPQYIKSMEDKIAKSPMVVVDGNMPQETIDALFHLCHSHSIPLFYEPTDSGQKSLKPFLTGLPEAMTYCSPNLAELCDMSTTILEKSSQMDVEYLQKLKRTDLKKLLNILTDTCRRLMEHHGLSVMMITLSAEGVLLVRRGLPDDPLPLSSKSSKSTSISAVHYPGSPADVVVSVSGAGDCLTAGFIAGILRGKDQHTCVNVGMQAARLSCGVSAAVPESLEAGLLKWEKPSVKTIVQML